jgi:hypothetical protein
MREALSSSETPVLTRATQRKVAEEAILPLAYSRNYPDVSLEGPWKTLSHDL